MKAIEHGPSKIFSTRGKWVERRTRSAILVCTCGGKFIRTRGDKQILCIKCIAKTKREE